MNIKKGVVATGVSLTILFTAYFSVAMASSGEDVIKNQMICQERTRKYIKLRLEKLAERLEIKSSQQSVWEAYARSVTSLVDSQDVALHNDADAATLSRFRAERVTEFAKKLSGIADATEHLQAVLTEDQRKVLNEVTRHYLHDLHSEHRWSKSNHGHGGLEHAHVHQGQSEGGVKPPHEPVAETQ